MATKSPRNDNAGRNRKVTKFALAGVAVLGVGAALTSAAWTDNVLFGGSATSGDIILEGSITGNPLVEADWFATNVNGSLDIPAAVFQGMTPNDTVTTSIFLRNNGQGDIELSNAVVEEFGPLFGFVGVADGATAQVTVQALDGVTLGPDDIVEVDVTLTTPDWDNAAKLNTDPTNRFTIDVQGTT